MPSKQTKTTQLTIPLTSLSLGNHGPFTSPVLPTNLVGYEIDLTNDASWPGSGDVITLTIEQTNDGTLWQFDSSVTLSGGQWFADRQKTIPTNSASWGVSLDNQGSTTRQIRLSANVLQACKLGATINSV